MKIANELIWRSFKVICFKGGGKRHGLPWLQPQPVS